MGGGGETLLGLLVEVVGDDIDKYAGFEAMGLFFAAAQASFK